MTRAKPDTSAKARPEIQCTAKAKTTGKRCGRYAIPGGTVCVNHGGKSPQVKDAAVRRLHTRQVQADAAAVLAHYGVAPLEDPLTELGKLASESRALLDALGARVNNLDELADFDEKRAPHIRVEVEMYERAMDRTHRLLDSLVKHGFSEREIKLAEGQAALVAGVIRRVIAGIGLTAEQGKQAQTLLAEEFRALDAIL